MFSLMLMVFMQSQSTDSSVYYDGLLKKDLSYEECVYLSRETELEFPESDYKIDPKNVKFYCKKQDEGLNDGK